MRPARAVRFANENLLGGIIGQDGEFDEEMDDDHLMGTSLIWRFWYLYSLSRVLTSTFSIQ